MFSTLKVSALSLVVVLVLNTSCKKDKAAGISGRQKLKSYTEDITGVGIGHKVEIFNVNYDAQDRITSIISTTKPGHRLEYNYLNNDKFTFEQIEDNKVTLHCDYFINGEIGKVDSLYRTDIRKDTTSFKYFYNSENKILKQKEYLINYLLPPVWSNTIDYIYDGKGTLTKKQESFSDISYQYDAVYKNTTLIEPGYIPTQELLPTHIYNTRFGRTTTTEYSYTYDDKGRLTSEKAAASDGGVTIRTYTYL
jgi:YD repeat-containing protein